MISSLLVCLYTISYPSGIIKIAMNIWFRKPILHAGLILAILLAALWFAGRSVIGSAQIAQAAPAYQIPIYTPTPGPDGRIIYIVKANDTLLGISLITVYRWKNCAA